MAFTLAPGISFCDAGGRCVFLDLPGDRYFCLGEPAERAFAALVDGATVSGDHLERLETLRASGVLVSTRGTDLPRPCRRTVMTSGPLDTDRLPSVSAARILHAALRLQRAKLDLRLRPLQRLCARLVAARARYSGRARQASTGELADLAATYQAAGRIVGALDECLAVSCALARHALAQGLRAELHLGVKLRPFQAHAWVLVDTILVSDRLETVCQFVPILIV